MVITPFMHKHYFMSYININCQDCQIIMEILDPYLSDSGTNIYIVYLHCVILTNMRLSEDGGSLITILVLCSG